MYLGRCLCLPAAPTIVLSKNAIPVSKSISCSPENDPGPTDHSALMPHRFSRGCSKASSASASMKHISSEPICAIHARGAINPATSAISPAFRSPNINCEPHVFRRPRSVQCVHQCAEITDNNRRLNPPIQRRDIRGHRTAKRTSHAPQSTTIDFRPRLEIVQAPPVHLIHSVGASW